MLVELWGLQEETFKPNVSAWSLINSGKDIFSFPAESFDMFLNAKDLNYSKREKEVMICQSKDMEKGFQKLECTYF